MKVWRMQVRARVSCVRACVRIVWERYALLVRHATHDRTGGAASGLVSGCPPPSLVNVHRDVPKVDEMACTLPAASCTNTTSSLPTRLPMTGVA